MTHLRELIGKCSKLELFQLKQRELIEQTMKSSLKWDEAYRKRNPNYDKHKKSNYVKRKVSQDTKQISIELMEETLKHIQT
jgi:hypothetical protein